MTSAPPSYPAYPGPASYPAYPAYPDPAYPVPGRPGPPVVPPPPPGPGVQAPFPAPPVEGRGKRIGTSLGIGAGVLLLICGGGVAAVIGLAASMSGALNEQAHKAVTQYLDAVDAQQYGKAYSMLCRQAKDDETPAEFQDRVSGLQPIQKYQLGDLDLLNLSVPVDATYADGDTAELEAYLGQNQDTGAFEVCDVGE
jgi:hypothetical protein